MAEQYVIHRGPPEPVVNMVTSSKGSTAITMCMLCAEYLIVSMLFVRSQAPDNPVPEDSVTPLHRMPPHEPD